MEFKINSERKEQLKLIAVFLGTALSFFLFFKYIFPLIWPFLVSLGLALLFYPIIVFFHKRLKMNKILAAILLLLLVTIVVGFISVILVDKVLSQVSLFVDNFSYYQYYLNEWLENICGKAEEFFGIQTGTVIEVVNYEMNGFVDKIRQKAMNFLIGTSLPAVKSILDIIITGAVVLVLFFLIIKDMEEIREKARNSIFGKELGFFYSRAKVVFQAYVRAQLIIMAAVAASSVLGFRIAGNRYAWVLGIAVGVLDALPLFGSGMILIPVTIFYMILGNFVKAAIIFTTFIACYFIREILEPKLIGDKIGVGPVVTLTAIYIGYRLFGFLGMFAGALTVIVIVDILKGQCKKKN